jgi:cytochrome c biogenesis protein CcmG/thiol:disulfide interchange protein DsbE
MRRILTTLLIGLSAMLSSAVHADIDFDALKGKVVYIDFWASWCGPCRASFPWMNDMHTKYSDQDLVIIAVNLDQEPELAEEFIAEMKPAFRIEYDPKGKLAEQFGVDTMPTSFLIDRDGKAHSRHKGFHDGKRHQYERELTDLLNVSGE